MFKVDCKELCLDSKKELIEVNRHPGENEVILFLVKNLTHIYFL